MTTPSPKETARIIAASKRIHAEATKCRQCGTPTNGVDYSGNANCADCASQRRGVSITAAYLKKYREGAL